MNSNTSTTTQTSSPSFVPLDFLAQFVAGINGGVVFRTSDGSSNLSTIKDGDAVPPTRVREALDIVAGYFKPPGLSAGIDVNRVQQFAMFLAEIINHQHRDHDEGCSRFTAYELGNAVTALQKVLELQPRAGNN